MANYSGNGGRPAKRVDWDLVMFWLELRAPLYEVAQGVGLSPSHLTRRAVRELTDEALTTYRYYCRWNRAQDIPCGTKGGYQKHRRLGEPVDEACREAHRVASKEWRDRRGSGTQVPTAEEEGRSTSGD